MFRKKVNHRNGTGNVNLEQIMAALAQVDDPVTHKKLLVTPKTCTITCDDQNLVLLTIALDYPLYHGQALLRKRVEAALDALGITLRGLHFEQRIAAHAVQRGLRVLPDVRNIIAVASGKGGVGKSTTAVNLALALAAQGAQVGMLDADIYGPSVPLMLGLSGKPESRDGKMMEPHTAYGLQVNSIGFLVDDDAPVIWRGPMVTQALMQLLTQTRWQDLDYLIVDMPPGTGDIALTMAQKVPLTGAVIVSTPQDLALIDARKALRMFQKVDVSVLGIVENMAMHVCSQCGHAEPIFGEGGARKLASTFGLPWLGALPLQMQIRTQTDAGTPTVVAAPDSPAAQCYHTIATEVAGVVAGLSRDFSAHMPKVVARTT